MNCTTYTTIEEAWARACDARPVDIDGDYAEWAVVAIGQAMVWPSRHQRIERVEYAGADIRAWRKSLPVQYERVDDLTEIPTDRLLWHALRHVGRAEFWTPKEPLVASEELRVAEALLRTWWKRQERPWHGADLTGADPDGGVDA